jgi:lysophospholipase L1-like esterase
MDKNSGGDMDRGQHAFQSWVVVFACVAAILGGCAAAPVQSTESGLHWVASWGTANMAPDPSNVLPDEKWRDASLRQLVHVSLGGKRLRLRFSNVYGTTPLEIDAATIAKSVAMGQPEIVAGSMRRLTFAGRESVMIPAGGEYYTDPVDLDHSMGADLAISLHYNDAPARQTGHPGSRATSFLAKGNRVADAAWPDAEKVVRWYQIADIEVEAPRSVGAVSTIGDSITDGHGATTDRNDRWPDALMARLAREGVTMGIVNTGIGGNRLLREGLGPNVTSRFDRDVIARTGVTHVIILVGVNDLGIQHRNKEDTPEARAKLVRDLEMGYRQLAERAHAHGICVIGGTILPYTGSDYYQPGPENDADRVAINTWIRTSGVFDAIADFDAATRDPAHPERMLPELDSDHLHPGPAGFRAMAGAVPLSTLRSCH